MIKFTKRTWNVKISEQDIKIMTISNGTGHTVYNTAERASESWLCTKPRFESHVCLSFGLLAWPIGIKVGPTRWADFASFIRPYGGSWDRVRQTSKISREYDGGTNSLISKYHIISCARRWSDGESPTVGYQGSNMNSLYCKFLRMSSKFCFPAFKILRSLDGIYDICSCGVTILAPKKKIQKSYEIQNFKTPAKI